MTHPWMLVPTVIASLLTAILSLTVAYDSFKSLNDALENDNFIHY